MERRGRIRTPGSLPERESCIRTLIVSRGWQHNYVGAYRASNQTTDIYVFGSDARYTYCFHGTCYAARRHVGRKSDRFFLWRHGCALVMQEWIEGAARLSGGRSAVHDI